MTWPRNCKDEKESETANVSGLWTVPSLMNHAAQPGSDVLAFGSMLGSMRLGFRCFVDSLRPVFPPPWLSHSRKPPWHFLQRLVLGVKSWVLHESNSRDLQKPDQLWGRGVSLT